MARAVISYDKDLPEIPGRRPWEKPTSFLVKDDGGADRLAGGHLGPAAEPPAARAEDPSGRGRMARTGLPRRVGSDRRLFEYWFEEDHEVAGFPVPFRYYFCQREAIETLVWLVEIAGNRDAQELIQSYAEIFQKDLLSKNIEFQTTMDGRRQIRRYVPELDGEGVQDLPPEDLRRFAFKMATGSGKTWVIAMAVVWSHFHKKRVPKSELSTNFLIVAPNVIVYQRLEKDFASNRIFHELPLVPPEWGQLDPKVILRGDATEPDPSGNLFLTNIHQLYESRDQEWTPQNAVDALLGKKPAKDLAVRSALDAGADQVAQGPRSSQRRGPPRPRRGSRLEPVAPRDPPGATERASASGSTSPLRRRTRTGCTSLGRSATTRLPRRWRTASSRHH